MRKIQTRLSAKGQVCVPAAVRRLLQLMPGAVMAWTREGDRFVVERAERHSTAEVHRALFPGGAPGGAHAKTLAEVKQGLRQNIQRRSSAR